MPFYRLSEMEEVRRGSGPSVAKTVAGELMKVAVVAYQDGEGPMPHVHPNEEQYLFMLEGEMRMILGDEDRLIGPGDLVHIPKGVQHGTRAVGPVKFFTVKSPAGNGEMAQDSKKAPDAADLARRLATPLG